MAIDAQEADPIAYFLEDISHHGRTGRTVDAYERVLYDFEQSLIDERGLDTLGEATYRDCMSWLHGIRAEHTDSTVATYATYLHRFYAYMSQVGAFDDNPMTLVMEELDESINSDPTRRDLTLEDMRWFVQMTTHPLDRAVVCTFLKTGVRSGELCNLDLRDLHLTGLSSDMHDETPRAGLQSRPNSLYVDSEPTHDQVTNGERRVASNKRKRSTIIPIDPELKHVLAQWLAIRPDPISPAEPLFVSTRDKWGNRLTPDMVHHLVEQRAKAADWYRKGGGPEENVTPHYFRHFFTTHLRDRIGDRGIVKYLRGDVADDIIDTYTHNWGDRVRARYEAHIYGLL